MFVQTDVRPSTDDIVGPSPEADLTLVILTNARARINRRHTTESYVRYGAVCAVGGVMAAVGLTHNKDNNFDHIVRGSFYDEEETYRLADLEIELIEAAKEALALLDSVAVELYPEYRGSHNGFYSIRAGDRIEDVNQAGDEDANINKRQVKRAVLHCYDVAIDRRKAETLC